MHPTPPRTQVSVTIITKNEEHNLAQAIESVSWADEVLVIDSGSTDKTIEIAKKSGARVLQHPWQGYGQQKNYAQQQTKYDWVLSLDADETVPAALAKEIQQVLGTDQISSGAIKGFSVPRRTYYLGHWIQHGGWYPNYLVRVADRRAARWSEPPVHESLIVTGEVKMLENALDHFSFNCIYDQVVTNLNFSKLGSQELQRRGQSPSIFKLLFKPAGKFIETYFLKKGFLDGLPGLVISVNAAYSMFLKYAYLLEGRIRKNADPHH